MRYNDLLKKYQEAIRERNHYRKLSQQDTMLQIYNRTTFLAKANEMRAKCNKKNQRCAILFVDCDNFGLINKKYGHKMGDEIIKKTTEEIRAVMRSDSIVGRYGGDEILVFMPNAAYYAATACAKRICDHLADNPTVSIGCASGFETVAELLAQAEKKMRRVKKNGGNNYEI